MASENDKVLEAMQRWENRIWGGFKLIAVTIAVVTLLILKFDDIDKALKLKTEAAMEPGQHCTCRVPAKPSAPPKKKPRIIPDAPRKEVRLPRPSRGASAE